MNGTPTPRRSRRPGWWTWVAFALAIFQFGAYLVPQARPGLVGAILWMFGSDQVLWAGLAVLLLIVGLIWSAWRRPFWSGRRTVAFAVLVALAVSPRAFRTYPSSHDGSPSLVRFRLPLDGPITVGWGGATPQVNYHVIAPDQRWAYDLAVTRDGRTHPAGAGTPEQYYVYGAPVLAPADGTVRAVHDGEPDMAIGVMGAAGADPCGNHVIIEVGPSEFLFLCHMQPGSVAVKPGDTVKTGQVVGHVGNSGNTSEPHLHIHLQDTPEPYFGEGIPLCFHHYRLNGAIVDRGIPTGGMDPGGAVTGQIVENAP